MAEPEIILEEWQVWAIVGGIIGFIFICCFFFVLCFRRSRKESMVQNILARNYSRHSVTSRASFIAAPWRTSVHIGSSSSMNPAGAPLTGCCTEGMPEQKEFLKPLNSLNNERFTRGSMALEIIQEYEEKEAELGLGMNNNSEVKSQFPVQASS